MKKSIVFLTIAICLFIHNYATAQPYLNLQQTSGSNDVYYFDGFRKWTFDSPNSTINMSKNDGSNKTYSMDGVRIITFENDGNNVIIQYPSLSINSASIITGQTLIVSGTNFSKSTGAILKFENLSKGFRLDTLVGTNSSGTFTFPIVVSNVYPEGYYTVSGMDTAFNLTSNIKQFRINPTILSGQYLVLRKPFISLNIQINETLYMEWSDKMIKSNLYPSTLTQRKYKYFIEDSTLGNNWSKIDSLDGWSYFDMDKVFQ